jgi:hypothetical protein
MAKRGCAGTGTDEEMYEVIGNGTPQSSMGGQQRPGSDVGRDTRREDVAVQVSELAQDLQSERSTQEVLEEIVAAAVANVPGAGQAGISQVQGRRRISTAAATADLVRQVDQAQYDTGEGPCLSTIYEQITALVPDTSTENR